MSVGKLTILDFGHFATYFSQNLTSPALAVAETFAGAGHARAFVAPSCDTKFCGLGLAKAIKHGPTIGVSNIDLDAEAYARSTH